VSEHERFSFAASVGKSIGKCANRPGALTGVRFGIAPTVGESVGISVGDYGRGFNFFATLGQIPTGASPSV